MLSVSFGNVETLALELGSLASLFGSVALSRRRDAFEAWQGAFRQFGTMASLFGSVALPRRREAFEAWQGAFRQFRTRRKKVCLGNLASLYALATWLPYLAPWLSHSEAMHLRGGRVLSVSFGKVCVGSLEKYVVGHAG